MNIPLLHAECSVGLFLNAAVQLQLNDTQQPFPTEVCAVNDDRDVADVLLSCCDDLKMSVVTKLTLMFVAMSNFQCAFLFLLKVKIRMAH